MYVCMKQPFDYSSSSTSYLSNKTTIKRLWCTLWIAHNRFISKVMQVTSSHKTITAIVPRATNSKHTFILTWFVDLPKQKWKDWQVEIIINPECISQFRLFLGFFRVVIILDSSYLLWIVYKFNLTASSNRNGVKIQLINWKPYKNGNEVKGLYN